VFTKRTQSPYRAPDVAASAKDALAATLAEVGHVDMAMMTRLYGKSEETITKELGDLLFKNPAGGYETRDHYLSGNVKQKLAIAERAAKGPPVRPQHRGVEVRHPGRHRRGRHQREAGRALASRPSTWPAS
jgi:N12 class adenine-specific DNA methylase